MPSSLGHLRRPARWTSQASDAPAAEEELLPGHGAEEVGQGEGDDDAAAEGRGAHELHHKCIEVPVKVHLQRREESGEQGWLGPRQGGGMARGTWERAEALMSNRRLQPSLEERR